LLNHLENRSDGAIVIILTSDQGTMPPIFGCTNHGHAVMAFLGCTIERVGTGAGTAAQSSATAAQVGQVHLLGSIHASITTRRGLECARDDPLELRFPLYARIHLQACLTLSGSVPHFAMHC